MTLSQKTKIASVLLSAAVLFSACQQVEISNDPENLDPTDIVYATIEDPADTRTYLDGKKVLWNSGDEILAFIGKNLRRKYVVSAESVGTSEGSFIRDADYEHIGSSSLISHNIAFYPFAELICKVDGENYVLENLSLPSVQTYVADSFDPGSFPMMAVSADTDDVDFRFKNLCGVLKLQLQGEGTIASITVKGNSDEILAGSASVTMSHGVTPALSLVSDGAKEVTLDCGEGVVLNVDTPTSFLIALPPTDFTNGFTVTVSDTQGESEEYTTTKQNFILRSAILRMPVKEYTAERQPQNKDYIDEYGINHGQGIKIGETVWAPVNCGYHKDDFKYGKLYQWGRRYGQGYDGVLFDGNGNIVGTYSDATVPTIKPGPVSLSDGQSESNSNIFYTSDYDNNDDWLSPQDGKLWNSGTEEAPVKTEYDPCPAGWRVPSYAELDELNNKRSSWTTDENGQVGYWFSGASAYTSEVPQVFFPAAGLRSSNGGNGGNGDRRGSGYYWSYRQNNYKGTYAFYFNSSDVDMGGSHRANGFSVRCVQNDSELVPVASLTLDRSSLTMEVEQTYTLSATITPSNANHQSAHWWSDDESIATVDQSGNVTAVSLGTATITAMAGMQVATCEVTVTAVPQNKDYIDEYGVNHGQGIKIGETVWAPVNCGYHETDFKYGKLYQWGRKYGQGYNGKFYDGDWDQTYSDAFVPEKLVGPVSLTEGQSKDNENKLYQNSSYPWDWLTSQDDNLWNSGTEDAPVKTENDPCPAGWRVPTSAELSELKNNYSGWTTDDSGQRGRWLSGLKSYSDKVPQVFFSAAGRSPGTDRGNYGFYWSSRASNILANYLDVRLSDVSICRFYRVHGQSVRCVQVTDEVAEL